MRMHALLFCVLASIWEAAATPVRPHMRYARRDLTQHFTNSSAAHTTPTADSVPVKLKLRLPSSSVPEPESIITISASTIFSTLPLASSKSMAQSVQPAHEDHNEPTGIQPLPTADIPNQDFDFVNRNPPPKSIDLAQPSKSARTLESSPESSSETVKASHEIVRQSDSRDVAAPVTITIIRTLDPSPRPSTPVDTGAPQDRVPEEDNELSSSRTRRRQSRTSTTTSSTATEQSRQSPGTLSSTRAAFSATTSAIRPSAAPGSGEANDNGKYSNNKKEAIEANKRFSELSEADKCTAGDTVCLNGSIATCQGQKFVVTFKCQLPTKCFALPYVSLAGYNVACAEESEALRLLGVPRSGLSKGPGNGASDDAASKTSSLGALPSTKTLPSVPVRTNPSTLPTSAEISSSIPPIPSVSSSPSRSDLPTETATTRRASRSSSQPSLSASAVTGEGTFTRALTVVVTHTTTKAETTTTVITSTSVVTSIVTRVVGAPNGIIAVPV